MNFHEKLQDILENERFIEREGYHHDLLKKLFLGNISDNLDVLIRETFTRLTEQEIWSFVNFLRIIYENNESLFSTEDMRKI